ncbi:hypothetical protein CTA2_1701 [Colletotrichum tanaceti]|uniref:Uncharacterized protein n=1 Tax=Colletotrichum tanaceti TaxID=1306861 RepID=A0A4U6WYV1_9PEZI|nr:hypothetical protein CTA2_1701 [Colletotrichum tanaceti]TKW48328.1 hypothetical protein CTA1_6159 [Colletotrichum tanaceti]
MHLTVYYLYDNRMPNRRMEAIGSVVSYSYLFLSFWLVEYGYPWDTWVLTYTHWTDINSENLKKKTPPKKKTKKTSGLCVFTRPSLSSPSWFVSVGRPEVVFQTTLSLSLSPCQQVGRRTEHCPKWHMLRPSLEQVETDHVQHGLHCTIDCILDLEEEEEEEEEEEQEQGVGCHSVIPPGWVNIRLLGTVDEMISSRGQNRSWFGDACMHAAGWLVGAGGV